MLPLSSQNALEQCFENVAPSRLKNAFEELSKNYRKGGTSKSVFDTEMGALAYLATRMGATFGAVLAVLEQLKIQRPDLEPKSLLDLGAGPGSASWAALEQFPSIQKATLLDHDRHAMKWGQKLAGVHPILQSADWTCASLNEIQELPQVDLIIASYAFNEIANPAKAIEAIWKSDVPFFVVVEPGTPLGFQKIKRMRGHWIELGGDIVAPCPHRLACPMAANDWCHFSARIPRTKLGRFLKEGDLGFEDEKYSYFIGSKSPSAKAESRIVRHPIKHKGHVQFVVCEKSGQIENVTVTKSNKNFYKKARDLCWGDCFSMVK